MDDELKLRRDMERASLAASILENEIMAEAFVMLDQLYVDVWKATKYDDTVSRENLWKAQHIVGKVRGHLQAVVASGQLSARQIERDFARPKRFGIV